MKKRHTNRINPYWRKQIKAGILIVVLTISGYLTMLAYHYGIFRIEQQDYPVSVRISNVHWKFENITSTSDFANKTCITFFLEMEVWVAGDSNVSYYHSTGWMFKPGFTSSFTGFTGVEMEEFIYAAVVINFVYPPGSSYYMKTMRIWVDDPNATALPNGLFDFWFGKKGWDLANIYHTYLRISNFGLRISHDAVPDEWGAVDWDQNGWGAL
ncbi:MAG: hypothetical protein ACTSWW_08960 [Promethearchaeota archaeon]